MRPESKIAFVVDALPGIGGGEKTLFAALEAYPRAEIFTLIYNKDKFVNTPVAHHKVTVSFLNAIPLALKYYRSFLPLMPAAIERFDLSAYDIVVSFSYAVAHGVRVPEKALHISYTYTPMRYAWSEINLDGKQSRKNPLVNLLMKSFRKWDKTAVARLDEIATISQFISKRIQQAYHRKANVIYPPVEIDRFHPCATRENYYVTLSRLVAHKRIDLIVQSFSRLKLPLKVIGDGSELSRLQKMAASNIQFLTNQSDKQVAEILNKARGLVCAAEEDFGIAVVEAQAAGCPVIAYEKGGALETVTRDITGLFFAEQSAESLMDCVKKYEDMLPQFRTEDIVENSKKFSRERFIKEFIAFVENARNPLKNSVPL
jgi:glycosyltransferase involved in cell wall biosynthesis